MMNSYNTLGLAFLVLVALGLGAWLTVRTDGMAGMMPRAGDRGQTPPQIELEEEQVSFSDGTETRYQLASDFSLSIAAEDLGKARFLTMSPDGRLFVPNMVDFTDNTEGEIYILEDFNEGTHMFETRTTYLSGLRNPNSIAFYTDSAGDQWIYIALTDELIRYPYNAGDTEPPSAPEVVTTFPDYRTVDNDVWHITRTIHFRGDELYVSVGSSCNVCEEPEDEIRAEIITMTPTGENIRTYAEGLRNAVGIEWAEGELYATVNGVDHQGAEAPDDVMYRIEEGEHYGFPYCYELNGEMRQETEWTFFREGVECEEVPLSFTAFGPHMAPLGVTYFEEAHPTLENAFLVALHGSYDVGIGNGYQLMRVSEDGTQEVFMDGFLEDGDRWGRPVHVLQRDRDSFFFTDDFHGRLYYVYAEEGEEAE